MQTTTRHLAAALAAAAISAVLALAAPAEDVKAGAISIEGPWARPTVGEGTSTAAYMKIANGGDEPDRLVSVASDAADHVMLHESRMEGEVMKMVHLSGGIAIPAHGTVELKPLGLHVMVMGLKAPLKAGDALSLTLRFEKQGEVKVDAKVGAGPAQAADHKTHGQH
jgi:copper(I)-binding protein